MPVIALTQEMGSLAPEVGAEVSRRLGLRQTTHEVEGHVADRLQIPRSMIRRLREGQAGLIERFKADAEGIALYSAEEVYVQAAQGDVVLRGWGATCLLRAVPHVPCVRITRSLPNRTRWLMEHLDTDDVQAAQDEVRRSDEAHAARMHQQFGVTWGDPLLYDLVLNTDRLSVETCAQQIVDLVARPEFAETPQSRAAVERLALEWRIRAALKNDESVRDVKVTIEPQDGHVALRGIVLSNDERAAIERIVAAVPGVAGVDNQLRLMGGTRLFSSAKV